MSQMAHDLRASIRIIRRRPLIPIVVVTILALGLAACVTVFTCINRFQQSFPGTEARGRPRSRSFPRLVATQLWRRGLRSRQHLLSEQQALHDRGCRVAEVPGLDLR